ncbi:glycosyltransferase 61 family protein [Jannaschia sp. 2305UL9-9]|uniref:glycosyltransferase 61 family protein n=1 Tax=Jannaschia sp. 2305UL9-9 TaxID=3121638 RepID=UPI0035295594
MNAAIRKSWSRPPEDFFFCPGIDPGLSTLAPLPPMWRTRPRARLAAGSVSAYPEVSERITDHIDTHFRRRAFRAGIETTTIPVLLEDVVADGHFLSVGGKWLLTGAAGTRLRNRYAWKNEGRRDTDAETSAYFARLQADDPPPPPVTNRPPSTLPFVIDLRNGTNFYHFLTETVGQLCAVDTQDFAGPVHIHTKGEEVRPFIRAWVEALFPRLRGRVRYLTRRASYDRALSVLNSRHYYYQTSERVIPSLDQHAPDSHFWKGRDPDRNSQAVFAMNSCDQSMVRLRETAHRLIADGDWSHLPRRFWVGRKSDRNREMAGETALTEQLAKRGFSVVYFEDLSPLEQVAIMARAEVMMSYHGAGFANMLFAGKDTHCIEVGTLQTCLYRWQDFMPHALASGCRYTSLFADYNVDDPQDALEDRQGKSLAPVALGPVGQAKVLGFVDALLGRVRVANLQRLQELADLLARLEDYEALKRLLDAHPGAEKLDPDLMILRANALQGTGDPGGAFDALAAAWQATGDRPFLLERLILLGRDLGRDTRASEAEHAAAFEKRATLLARKLRRQAAVQGA